MNIEIAEYSASLTFPDLSLEAVRQIKEAAKESLGDLDVLVTPTFLDFDYSGRDTGRKVVKFLCRAALLIGSAEGEVECRLTTDSDERHFEFYSIQHSRLYKQEAELIRLPRIEICPDVPEVGVLLVSAS